MGFNGPVAMLVYMSGGALKVEKISSKTTCPLSISTQRETDPHPLTFGEAQRARRGVVL